MERLSRSQNRGRKLGMVRGIGKMLSLETESVTPLVHMPLLACDGSIQKVSGIKLNSGLVGGDLHDAATRGLIRSRG